MFKEIDAAAPLTVAPKRQLPPAGVPVTVAAVVGGVWSILIGNVVTLAVFPAASRAVPVTVASSSPVTD